MKKTIKLLCTWAAGLLLAGCSSEADMSKLMDWQSNPDAVHFTASVNNATTRTNPAATNDDQTKFNENDQVTVSNNGNQADYAYNGTSWAPAIANKYLLLDKSNLTFNCWYPAGGKNTATVGYLTADQSSAELMAKSDYMNAEKTLKTSDEALNFNLERKTARLILKISAFTDVPGTIKHVRIVSKASTAEGETNTIAITPFAQKGEGEIGGIGTTYTALVIPGEVVAKFYFTDDTSSEEPLTMTTNVTAAGNSYIYNLNVIKRTKIEVTGIKAGPWTANGTTTGDLICYPYVTFKAEQAQTFKMTATRYTISGLQYSVKNGEWNDVVADAEVEFGGEKGDLRLRGKDNLGGTSRSSIAYSTITFGTTADVACTGDIRTLLDYESFETVATGSARFCYLFKDCTQLTSAPNLPATKLADGCYSNMFYGCTNLKTVPTLPAMKMFSGVYRSMFQGCTSLENAPDLPATELADYCYAFMFKGCTKLKKVPDELPALTMASSCYKEMFLGCTSLKKAPQLPATTLAYECYRGMFQGCKGLEKAPELKATSLKESCYLSMFYGCTSLTAAPDLPAKELAETCYAGMFSYCSSLETGPKELLAITLAERCYDSMFSSCTSLKTVPDLPATTLEKGCYTSMFSGCTSLVNAPALSAMTLAENCYQGMFSSCANLSSVKMLASSDQITSDKFKHWLYKAGTSATTRKLIVQDKAAYDALVKVSLPIKWKTGTEGATVEYAPKQ